MHIQFLKQLDIFRGLPEHLLEIISTKVKVSSHKKSHYIFHEHEPAKAVYFVKSGIVKLKKINEQGKELTVCMKKSGDLFAEASLFNEPGTFYPATAQMVTKGEVLHLSIVDLEELIHITPEVGIAMIRFMSMQLRSFTETLRDTALLDVYNKTAQTIKKLAIEFGEKNQNEIRINVPLSIQELSNIVGASRETVSRAVSKLREQGFILLEGKTLVVNNWCGFCKMDADTENHKNRK